MIITKEISLKDFEFWGGAAVNAKKLTDEELERFDDLMSEDGEPWDETSVNDWFWFSFDAICEDLGLDYDPDSDEIRRE